MRLRYFFKIVQRRTYDILSNRMTLFCFIALFVVLPTTVIVMFEKILWIWNSHQSLLLFKTDYCGLMVDKSGSMTICENKPAIDVVYTWVNGSEANFLKSLLKVKRDYLREYGPEINCSIPINCHESNNEMTYIDTSLVAIEISTNIVGLDMFRNKRLEKVKTESLDEYYLMHLTSGERSNLEDYFKLHTTSNPVKSVYVRLDCSNHTLSNQRPNLAENFDSDSIIFLSSSLPNQIFPSESTLSSEIPSLPSSTYQWLPPKKQLIKMFNEKEKTQIKNIVFHSSRRVALIILEPFISHYSIIERLESMGQRFNFTISIEPKLYIGNEDLFECSDDRISESMTVNRFADNDELKYSIRSIEKFAPWIHNIYLVTNGQIPNWLNINHPRLRLITHEDIFPNKSDLPTFNSAAIECHLHRIPGLSERFLYLNDDIMLGKPVYLEDFYSPTSGYKIYLAWPVPNCEPGCPTSWLNDGFCDQACNTSLCLFDGGDCINQTSTQQRPNLSNYRGGPSSFSASKPLTDQCRPSCADFWLGDKYCDNVCNHPDCAFDMGDCGIDGYQYIPGTIFHHGQSEYFYPSPLSSIYINLTNLMSSPDFSITRASYEKDNRIRSVTLNLKYKVITVLFSGNITEMTVPINLSFKTSDNSFDIVLRLNVTTEFNSKHSTSFDHKQNSNQTLNTFQMAQSTMRNEDYRSMQTSENVYTQNEPIIIFDLSSIETNHNISGPLNILKKITKSILNSSLTSQAEINGDLIELISAIAQDKYEDQPIGMFPWENVDTFKKLGEFIANHEKYLSGQIYKSNLRQLLDIFSDSVKYVNHIYNQVFGIEARKIMAHSPILLDKNIIRRLWNRFPAQLSSTSSHKLRSSDDMQFSFAYFNFLMSETSPTDLTEVIGRFNTDESKGLSANEIRSLLANVVQPSIVKDIWSNYSNCWNGSDFDYLKQSGIELSIDELLACKQIADKLKEKFAATKRNRYSIMSDSDVAFTMIRSNHLQLMKKLDQLRREPKKFLCFNDDLQNSETEEVRTVRSELKDYYQYLVPKTSSYELSEGRTNFFKNISHYRTWKKSRIISPNVNESSTWIYFCLYGSLMFWIIYRVLTKISHYSSKPENIKTLRI